MVIASKIKSSLYAWLCVMVVVLGLAENRAGGFFAPPEPAPGQIEAVSPEAVGENYEASAYDASGYAVAPGTGATVFRVQGGVLPNASKVRFVLDDAGQIAIRGDDMLFINVNQEARALEFLAKRGDTASLVKFQIKPEFLDKLRSTAVPQRAGRQFPNSPQLVDPRRAPDQFGIPSSMFDELLENIVPGSTIGL